MLRWLSRTLSLVALVAPPAAQAAAVVIWPIDPTIKQAEQATSLWLENKGDVPVTMQVRTFAWSQRDNEDALDPQDAIVASPPIARVAPGERQLIRIIRRAPAVAPETAYRLIVDELPPPPPTGNEAPQAKLAVQMRYSLPLFAYGAVSAGKPQLAAAVRIAQSGRELVIANTGKAHARLTDLRLVDGHQETIVRGGLAGYVLPGAAVTIPLPPGAGTLHVAVNGVDQPLLPST